MAFTAATLMLTVGGYTGYIYLATAVAMGLSWLTMALSGFKKTDERIWAKKLFAFSILTIAVLSVMMATDFTVSATSQMLLTSAQ